MDDNTEKFDQPPKRDAAVLLNKMERAYLSVLRAGALIIASLLLLYAAWLCVSGLYHPNYPRTDRLAVIPPSWE